MTKSASDIEVESLLDPQDFIIKRKRKLYRFALFHNSPFCFEIEAWTDKPIPTVLELGAGTGLFSVALANEYSDVQHVAVDVKADRLQLGARHAKEMQLSNVRFLRARADQLSELLAVHSLQSIWVTFPDPLPKSHAAKNRLLHNRFLSMYRDLLKEDGSLYFKTDAKDLFEWSLEQLVMGGWIIRELSFDLHESELPGDYKIKTTYENKYLSEGLNIMFVRATPPSAI
jgi:tRNA (guanine-N7-)-methyltransferase